MGTQGWQTEASESTMPPPWAWAEPRCRPGSAGTRCRVGNITCTALWALHLWETQSWSRGMDSFLNLWRQCMSLAISLTHKHEPEIRQGSSS